MTNLWGREPVMILAMVQSLLGLVMSFGIGLNEAQVGAIMGFTAAVLGFVARSQVSPGGKGPIETVAKP